MQREHIFKYINFFGAEELSALTCSIFLNFSISDLRVRDHSGRSAPHYAANINSPLREEIIHMMFEALSHTGTHSLKHECDKCSDILHVHTLQSHLDRRSMYQLAWVSGAVLIIFFSINTGRTYGETVTLGSTESFSTSQLIVMVLWLRHLYCRCFSKTALINWI